MTSVRSVKDDSVRKKKMTQERLCALSQRYKRWCDEGWVPAIWWWRM